VPVITMIDSKMGAMIRQSQREMQTNGKPSENMGIPKCAYTCHDLEPVKGAEQYPSNPFLKSLASQDPNKNRVDSRPCSWRLSTEHGLAAPLCSINNDSRFRNFHARKAMTEAGGYYLRHRQFLAEETARDMSSHKLMQCFCLSVGAYQIGGGLLHIAAARPMYRVGVCCNRDCMVFVAIACIQAVSRDKCQ
jgi:hypothetical protein